MHQIDSYTHTTDFYARSGIEREREHIIPALTNIAVSG